MTGWAPARIVAAYTGRTTATIRRWTRDGHLPTMCDAKTGQQMVHAASAQRLAEQRKTRRRRGRVLTSADA